MDRSLSLGAGPVNRNCSIRWKEIESLGLHSFSNDWFGKGLRKKIGRGDRTRFWEDVWVGDKCFKDIFPHLYSLSEQRGLNIEDLGEWWSNGVWDWRFVWRREMFLWEKELLLVFHNTVGSLSPVMVRADT